MTSQVVRYLRVLLLAWLAACSSEAGSATQIVLTVESDLMVPSELDRVTIGVLGKASAPPSSADLTTQGLPRTLGLVHDGGALGPFVVKATGYLGTMVVVEKAVSTSFVKGKTVALTLRLESACRGVLCEEEGFTCVAGECMGIPTEGPDADAGSSTGGDGGTSAGDGGTSAGDGGSGSAGDGGATNTGDGGATNAGDGGAGAPPSCTISLPVAMDFYQTGKAVTLTGTCTDPETGMLTTGLVWTSSLDGPLGEGANDSATLSMPGIHTIELCAMDPRDSKSMACDQVTVTATLTAQPNVSITSIKQSNSTMQPFRSTAPISLVGQGTGAGISLSWSDSIRGALGTGPSASLTSPEIGKHVATLRGTDRNNVTLSTTASFTVLAPGQGALIEPYVSVNTTLGSAGGSTNVAVLGRDPSDRVYAAANSKLYRFDADQVNPLAAVALETPAISGAVQDVFVDVAAQLAYLATGAGLTVCSYVVATGIGTACNTFSGGDLPSNSVRSVLRFTATNNKQVLLIGTISGLLDADAVSGSNEGNTAFGVRVDALAAAAGLAWAATDDGLYRYNPVNRQTQQFGADEGAPSDTLTSLAVDAAGHLWVGSTNGLARFVPGPNTWTIWRTAQDLVNDSVNAVAVARVVIAGVARDVIWVATNGGVSRFDPTLNAFTNFTTADGLPSDTVRDVVVLSDGTKVFATASGIARLEGL